MNIRIMLPFGLAILMSMLTACDRLQDTPSLDVVVIDLEAVAAATGEDKVIEQKMEETRADLTAQLNELATDLEARLEAERAKLDDSASFGAQQDFLLIQAEARQQLAQAQAQAQQEAQRYQAGLVNEFHQKIKPIAGRIAAQHGARITLLADPTNFWFDESAQITAEVIEALREEMPADVPATPAGGGEAGPAE